MARLHREGPERGGCDRPARDREPAGEAGVPAVDKQRDGAAERASGRHRRSLAGAPDVRREADGAAALRARRRIPHRAPLQPRSRAARGADWRRRSATGTEDIGFRNRVAIVFTAAPSHDVTLRVRDEHGRPAIASFLVEDALGRVYPARSKRLAPDFFFQPQVYRGRRRDVSACRPATYTLTVGRGPEYHAETPDGHRSRRTGRRRRCDCSLTRWIDAASLGWYSGDHHVHAAGCSHYESPTEGVRPEDMMRHVLGRGPQRRRVLNWGPCYYHQRQFFEARDNRLSTASTLMRYDVEVSGFPSSHCGHLVLLRLKEQDYPETRQIEDWPTWDLPILKWAKAQGAVAGFAHSGWGLQVAEPRSAQLRDAALRRHRRQRVHRRRDPRRGGLHLGAATRRSCRS